MISRTSFLTLIVGLWIGLSACASSPPPLSPILAATTTTAVARVASATPRPRATATPTRHPNPTSIPDLTEIRLYESLPPAQAEALAEDIQAFEQAFPQYIITLRHYDSPDALNLGSFDIVLVSPPLLNALWSKARLAPLSDFFPPSFIDGFAAPTLEGARQDDEVWGLADTAGFHLLLFYNRVLVNTPPNDTEEMFELAQNLSGDDRWGLGVNSYDPLWVVPWLVPYDGWLTDETGQPTLDTAAMAAALTLFQRWQGPNAIAPVFTYDEARTQFIAGKVGMLIEGEWAIDEFSQVDSLDWGVTLLPVPDDAANSQPPAPLILARYWAISRTASGNESAAIAAFLEYVTQPERQLTWTRRFGLLPTRREALNDPIIVTNPILRTSATQMLAGRSLPLGIDANMLLDRMRGPLRGLVEGQLTPEEAAQGMQKSINSFGD